MKPAAPWLLTVMFAMVACGAKTPEHQQNTAEEADQFRRTIVGWFECEECREGQLEAVVKLGEKAVPTLIATLRNGPPPANREALRRSLSSTYQQLIAHSEKNPQAKVPMSEQEYIDLYIENYVARYQSRSGKALAAIGGADAKRALEEALKAPIRDDVREAILDSLKIGTWPTPE